MDAARLPVVFCLRCQMNLRADQLVLPVIVSQGASRAAILSTDGIIVSLSKYSFNLTQLPHWLG